MRRLERATILSGLLAVVLLVITAGSPAALAQEAATPVPDTGCRTAAVSMSREVLPAGVVREMLVTTGVDSTAFATAQLLGLNAVASVVCIAANTDVVIGISGGPTNIPEIPQNYTVTLVVLEGELELKLVNSCAPPDLATPCATTTGQATFRTAANHATPVTIGADWTPIPAGSIVVLADVTISMRTTDDVVRLFSTGVAPIYPGGGACPTSCPNWRNP